MTSNSSTRQRTRFAVDMLMNWSHELIVEPRMCIVAARFAVIHKGQSGIFQKSIFSNFRSLFEIISRELSDENLLWYFLNNVAVFE